jgi:mannobiose 2-epimerase
MLLPVLLITASCKTAKEPSYLGVPVSQIQTELNSLLDHYYPRIVDSINGGYLTNFENDWTPSAEQHKMLVTQSRGLWTAARAAELFPDKAVFKEAAGHGYEFLTGKMWDTLNGGFYQNYYPDSIIKTDPFKLTYGNAFALFGLSQYALISKDPAVTGWVKKSFSWLETALHDSVYGGYFNLAIPGMDKLKKNDVKKHISYAGWSDPTMKDQNTSIHLLEAFTTAYQALPDESVKKRLTEMLVLVRDSMTTDAGYLNLYFNEKWQPVSNRDSSREYIISHPAMDHISFGHNIETAYLLVDASKALYGSPDSITLRVAKKLIDHTLRYGFDKVTSLNPKTQLKSLTVQRYGGPRQKHGMPLPCFQAYILMNRYTKKPLAKCGLTLTIISSITNTAAGITADLTPTRQQLRNVRPTSGRVVTMTAVR